MKRTFFTIKDGSGYMPIDLLFVSTKLDVNTVSYQITDSTISISSVYIII